VFPILEIKVADSTETHGRGTCQAGGAKVILATVTNRKAMSKVLGGLGINGKLIVIGAANEPLEVPLLPSINR
jgi:D-arabinose 1-dehydrogenase-like Zn-dependent alcohol dehydrogenase